MSRKCCEMLAAHSESFGGSGVEGTAIETVKGFLPDNLKMETDSIGNLLVQLQTPKEGYPHLLLDAHIDEITMVVTSITKDGFLRVAPCGGIDCKLLAAQEVEVHGAENFPGVVCAIAPHLQKDAGDRKVFCWDDILIDIGFTEDEAKERVALGDRITIVSPPVLLGDSYLAGKALDNRAGVTAVLLAAQQILEQHPACGVSLLFSVQEEVTGNGASVGAFDLLPDVAISVDVSFAQMQGLPDYKTGKSGAGPMIGISPTLTKWVSDKLISVAKQEKIPYQFEAIGGVTSTNADHLGQTRSGIATGLCSIPERYMHTPVETVAISDVENTARLLVAFAHCLGEEDIQR